MSCPGPYRSVHQSRVLMAIIIVAVGLVLLLGNLGVLRVRNIWDFWPMILVFIGLSRLNTPGASPWGRAEGGLFLIAGVLLLADNFARTHFWRFWPVLLILWGLLLLSKTLRADRTAPANPALAANSIDHVAVFGGNNQTIAGDDFRGGEISAIFGGSEIDLRKAGMEGEMAVLDVNVVFGGAEIRVPENWDVVSQGMGIFGGFGDKTLHPSPGTPGVKRLFVRGSAVFGGVEIKN